MLAGELAAGWLAGWVGWPGPNAAFQAKQGGGSFGCRSPDRMHYFGTKQNPPAWGGFGSGSAGLLTPSSGSGSACVDRMQCFEASKTPELEGVLVCSIGLTLSRWSWLLQVCALWPALRQHDDSQSSYYKCVFGTCRDWVEFCWVSC